MDCSICLDKINCLDFVRLLDCGHHFHNMCFLRDNGTVRCPMCRHLTSDSVAYCISNENFNFFQIDSTMFNDQIECIKTNRDVMKKQEYIDNLLISREKCVKLQCTIDKFFKEHINIFKFKILKAVKDEEICIDLYEADYGDSFEEYPIIFLLKGRRGQDNYFRIHGITSIIDKLYEYFRLTNIFIISDNVRRKNYIRVYV